MSNKIKTPKFPIITRQHPKFPETHQNVDLLMEKCHKNGHSFDRLLFAFREILTDNSTGNIFLLKILDEEGLKNHVTDYFQEEKELMDVDEVSLPSFTMFVKYILRHRNDDRVWTSHLKTLKPCEINSMIEERQIFSTYGNNFEDISGNYMKKWRKKYFRQVPCSLLHDLLNLYKYEIQLNSSGTHEYFKICSK